MNKKIILDACCGSRMFWFDKKNPYVLFQDIRDAEYVNHNFTDAEFGFYWWISDKGFDQYYADEVLQQKIEFNV